MIQKLGHRVVLQSEPGLDEIILPLAGALTEIDKNAREKGLTVVWDTIKIETQTKQFDIYSFTRDVEEQEVKSIHISVLGVTEQETK